MQDGVTVWENELDLADANVAFFDLPETRQQEIIEQFIEKSLAYAKGFVAKTLG